MKANIIKDPILFKNELKTYRYYVSQRAINQKKIKEIDDQLCSLHSPIGQTIIVKKRKRVGYKNGKPIYRTIKKEVPAPKIRSNPKETESHKLELISLKGDYEMWFYYYDGRIKDIDSTLNILPKNLRDLVVAVFINKLANRKARELGYSLQGLYKHIDTELNNCFKKE